MMDAKNLEPEQATTIAQAVSVYRRALESDATVDLTGALRPVDVSTFITPENVATLVHLLANTTLLIYAKLSDEDIEGRLEAAVSELSNSDWFVPLSLALLELRFHNQSVSRISEKEKRAIVEFYEIPEADDRSLFTYYKSGTTSLIFTVKGRAIKLIRPIYLIDEEISSLNKYSERYFNAPDSPTIHWSTPFAMAMDWVRGKTIDEILISEVKELNQAGKLKLISSVSRLILKIHKDGFAHGDLNPRNVIVQDWGDGTQKLVPIDYGFNYSLTKPVLSSQAYLESARYIAPSPPGTARDPVEDDIYSASVLMLDCWFGKTEKSPLELVHKLAMGQPLLASIIEYGLAHDHEVRGRNITSCGELDAKKSLDFFRSIVDACSKFAQDRNPATHTDLVSLFLKNPIEIWKSGTSSSDGDEDQYSLSIHAAQNRKLNFYRGICLTVTTVLISMLGFSASEAIEGSGWFSNLRNFWSDAGLSLTPRGTGFWGILPGYAICLSFGLVAAKYYLSIFRSISPSGTGQKFSRASASEFTMRFNSFAYAIPICYCFLLDPKAWPFCASIGLIFVAANNFCTKRFLVAVREDVNFDRLPISQSSDIDSAFLVFSGWGALVTSFALGISIAGFIIVTSDPAQNTLVRSLFDRVSEYNTYEYLIAFSVIMINYIKMQKENCGKLAATIRTMILRHIEASFVLSRLGIR